MPNSTFVYKPINPKHTLETFLDSLIKDEKKEPNNVYLILANKEYPHTDESMGIILQMNLQEKIASLKEQGITVVWLPTDKTATQAEAAVAIKNCRQMIEGGKNFLMPTAGFNKTDGKYTHTKKIWAPPSDVNNELITYYDAEIGEISRFIKGSSTDKQTTPDEFSAAYNKVQKIAIIKATTIPIQPARRGHFKFGKETDTPPGTTSSFWLLAGGNSNMSPDSPPEPSAGLPPFISTANSRKKPTFS